MAHSRKSIENPSDRVQLEQALAREMFATFSFTGKKVMTADRMEWIEKRFGKGAVNRVIFYMKQMQAGEID
jgi:endonuclease I